MSDSRHTILKNVRANRAEAVELPSLNQSWQTFDNALGQFQTALSALGAQCVVVPDRASADAWLLANEAYAATTSSVSLVDGVGRSTLDFDTLDSPSQLAGVDWAVLPGEFGVAENGAIWVADSAVRHRAVYFLCEHLVLVIPAGELVSNMHSAYDRINGFAAGPTPPFGAFIAGPSKTADIEQSLVIGAQGPRSLDVLLVET